MSLKVTLEIVFQYWEQLDCSTSLRLTILVRNKMWAEALAVKVAPETFLTPTDYAKANSAVAVLKKLPGLPGHSKDQLAANAISRWEKSEMSCFAANERLARYLVSPLGEDAPSQFLRRVRRKLISWLGYGPSDDELKTLNRHGPGSTFSSIRNPTAADKYEDVPTVTPRGCIHLLNIAGTLWMQNILEHAKQGRRVQVVAGNRHTTVPKSSTTDRNIGIEPSLNVYGQLGLGTSLRKRLFRTCRWDLDNAQGIHRKVAAQASVDGRFATLDLSDASDTLCKNLVRVLFRDTRWLSLMEDLRSTKTSINGVWRYLEKFSSMGNGYTFELETVIFAALCSVCLELRGHIGELGHDLFVFGDDIIVPTDCVDLVTITLQWAGFSVNQDKSFVSGPFRESCGGDYFLGDPVRGYYLKTLLTKRDPRGFASFHNGARACLLRCGLKDPSVSYVLGYLPERLRFGGSERLGDSVLHGLAPIYKWRNGIRWVRAVQWYRPVLIDWEYFSERTRLACRLTGYGNTFGIVSRGFIHRPEPVWVTDS